jgi:hypothetical protein
MIVCAAGMAPLPRHGSPKLDYCDLVIFIRLDPEFPHYPGFLMRLSSLEDVDFG